MAACSCIIGVLAYARAYEKCGFETWPAETRQPSNSISAAFFVGKIRDERSISPRSRLHSIPTRYAPPVLCASTFRRHPPPLASGLTRLCKNSPRRMRDCALKERKGADKRANSRRGARAVTEVAHSRNANLIKMLSSRSRRMFTHNQYIARGALIT